MLNKKNYISQEKDDKKIKDLFHVFKVGAKPFLKWAGGKSQLLDKFKDLYPNELRLGVIKNYYEPFVGSGAVFFDIVQNFNVENAFLYDINEELILTYRAIQSDVDKLIEYLYRYQKIYFSLSQKRRKEFYYEQRTNYNLQRFNINYRNYSENWIPRAAQLIFLNRTCYNGLYRVNSKGEFNSPAGDYENPTICDEKNLLLVNHVLQIATIKSGDYKEIQQDLIEGSFIYFDPPYRPLSPTSNFNNYSHQSFSDKEQIELANFFRKLNSEGYKLMLSNSDPKNVNSKDDFFDKLYKGFNIYRIPAKRMINSIANKRGEVSELVITNYPNYLWKKDKKAILQVIN
ncbi:DNA adenine methylase [Ignavibacterium sp.]|uniref:DNA adenine methylase n=1 Tax=Ignavibacterium sp. TaxID=2651167 RepID=UPI00307E4C0B